MYVPLPEPVFNEPPVWTYCSCVEFAKWYLGRQGERWGIARDIVPNVLIPQVGDLVLTNEGPVDHVGVITGVHGFSVDFVESNWWIGKDDADKLKAHNIVFDGPTAPCQKHQRTLNINDKKIKGFKRFYDTMK